MYRSNELERRIVYVLICIIYIYVYECAWVCENKGSGKRQKREASSAEGLLGDVVQADGLFVELKTSGIE